MLSNRPFAVLAATLLATAAAAPAGTAHNPLDDGQPIPSAWRGTGSFDKVSAFGPETVRFTTEGSWQVRAEGDPRTLERLRFVVKDGQLMVGRRSGDDARLPAATIYVTAPALRAATLAGSGAFAVDRLSGKQVSATVAGSGDLTVGSVSAASVTGTVAGSGDLAMAGSADEARLTIAGSGRFEGARFSARTANATLAGSGSAGFHSDGTVSAQISGSGDVTVSGRASCRQSRIGSGALRCGS